MPYKDERATAVEVLQEVLEGGDPVHRRRPGHDLDLLFLRHGRARRGVSLAVVGRVDVADRAEGGGLALERHLRAVHHPGIVDRADDRPARSGPVLAGIEIEDGDPLLLCGALGRWSQWERCW